MFQAHLAAQLAQDHLRELRQQATAAAQIRLVPPTPSPLQRLLTVLHLRPAGALAQTT